MNRRLIMFLISVVSLIFIVNISRSIFTFWQRGGVVAEREAIKDQLEAEKRGLEKKVAEVESESYIEKIAREKLNLQREGEVVLVLPQDLVKEGIEESPVADPNWKKWYKLFF